MVQDDLKTPVDGLVSRVDYRGINPTVWFLYVEMYGKDSALDLCRREDKQHNFQRSYNSIHVNVKGCIIGTERFKVGTPRSSLTNTTDFIERYFVIVPRDLSFTPNDPTPSTPHGCGMVIFSSCSSFEAVSRLMVLVTGTSSIYTKRKYPTNTGGRYSRSLREELRLR